MQYYEIERGPGAVDLTEGFNRAHKTHDKQN